MADQSDRGPEGLHSSDGSPFGDEAAIQRAWDSDINRAACVVAKGNHADAQDSAQQARLRLMAANRTTSNAPAPYLRSVISNTLKSARRSNARGFSASSPTADILGDDFPDPSPEPAEECADLVVNWTHSPPPALQQIYQHFYARGLSQREAARLMR